MKLIQGQSLKEKEYYEHIKKVNLNRKRLPRGIFIHLSEKNKL